MNIYILWYDIYEKIHWEEIVTHCIIMAIFSHLEFYKHVYKIKSPKDCDINEL